MSGIVYKELDKTIGVVSQVHEHDGKVTYQKTYDAEPFIEYAANMRQATSGEKWGEMRHVGTIPMAELATMMRQDGTLVAERLYAWLKANPKLVTFEKFLK